MGHLLRDGSHHDNCTLILVSHWCCGSGDARRQRLRMDYMCLIRFPADKKAVHGLGCQIAPGATDCFTKVYNDATDKQYRPLIVDRSNANFTDSRLRFRCGGGRPYTRTRPIYTMVNIHFGRTKTRGPTRELVHGQLLFEGVSTVLITDRNLLDSYTTLTFIAGYNFGHTLSTTIIPVAALQTDASGSPSTIRFHISKTTILDIYSVDFC